MLQQQEVIQAKKTSGGGGGLSIPLKVIKDVEEEKPVPKMGMPPGLGLPLAASEAPGLRRGGDLDAMRGPIEAARAIPSTDDAQK